MQVTGRRYGSTATRTERRDKQMTIAFICILSALLLGRAVSNLFFYIFAAISLVIFSAAPVKICIPILYYLLPFAPMLKMNTGSMSFFSVLFFLVALKTLYHHQHIEKDFLAPLIMLIVYCFIFSGIDQLTTIITIGGGLIMLYGLRDMDVNTEHTVISYLLGICLSSLLVVFKSSFPIVKMFANDVMTKLGEGNYASRFCGLQGNPNYYTLDIIIVLAAIVEMMLMKKASLSRAVCFAALTVFGMMSVSKSFILAWGVLVVFWFFSSARRGVKNTIKFIFVAAIAVAVVLYFARDSVDAYIQRFKSDNTDTATAASITTGRTDIWLQYSKEILGNYKILIFGNGLNTMITTEKGAHNTYIESIFTLGIIGTALYFTAIKKAMGKVITNRLMLIPIGMLLFRMLAIGMVVYDNLWFFLGLILLLAKECRSQASFSGLS